MLSRVLLDALWSHSSVVVVKLFEMEIHLRGGRFSFVKRRGSFIIPYSSYNEAIQSALQTHHNTVESAKRERKRQKKNKE